MNAFAEGVRRVVVVGCCGSGKSTLAAELARRLRVPHVERDLLGDEGSDEYRAAAARAVEADAWVFDGAPYFVEGVVYPRAQLVAALDYRRSVVMRRVIRRSLRLTLGPGDSGTHDRTPFRDWLRPDHHVRWAWTSWPERRREIAGLRARPELARAEIVRLASPSAAAAWLAAVGYTARASTISRLESSDRSAPS
jgi:adenylate kinase family enzyme